MQLRVKSMENQMVSFI